MPGKVSDYISFLYVIDNCETRTQVYRGPPVVHVTVVSSYM
jgi:hypothetical protein